MVVRIQLVTGVIALAVLAGVAGCGDGEVALYKAAGTVNVDGNPAEGAMVIFVPTSTAVPEADRKRPFGIADSQGKFELTTVVQNDGAPAGEYKVMIQWPSASRPTDDGRGGGRGALGPDRLKGKYFNVDKTPLTATVNGKANELPPFELTSK